MNWKNWFGIPGIGQPRDPEASDIRDPGLDAAVADVRRDHVDKCNREHESRSAYGPQNA